MAEGANIEITAVGLDWVERHAEANLAGHVGATAVLAKEATTTLTVLLAGMGGALAFVVKLLESGGQLWLLVGVATLTVYFLVLSGLLVHKCMMIGDAQSTYNEPNNLEYGEADIALLRRQELRGIQQRIELACCRNNQMADWLNRIRLAAVWSPAVFILSASAALLLARV